MLTILDLNVALQRTTLKKKQNPQLWTIYTEIVKWSGSNCTKYQGPTLDSYKARRTFLKLASEYSDMKEQCSQTAVFIFKDLPGPIFRVEKKMKETWEAVWTSSPPWLPSTTFGYLAQNHKTQEGGENTEHWEWQMTATTKRDGLLHLVNYRLSCVTGPMLWGCAHVPGCACPSELLC